MSPARPQPREGRPGLPAWHGATVARTAAEALPRLPRPAVRLADTLLPRVSEPQQRVGLPRQSLLWTESVVLLLHVDQRASGFFSYQTLI